MSKILWRHARVPQEAEPAGTRAYSVYREICIERAAFFNEDDVDLVKLPEERTYQVLGRAGLLLASVGLRSLEVLAPFLQTDPSKVGIYGVIERTPDHDAYAHAAHVSLEQFATVWKAVRSAKRFLREVPNMPVATVGILLGVMGPHFVFSHSRYAAMHALRQAETEVESGVVQAALVCGAFSLEDPLAALRNAPAALSRPRLDGSGRRAGPDAGWHANPLVVRSSRERNTLVWHR